MSEVEALIEKYDLDENLPSMRSVGYRQALEFLLKSDLSLKSKREMEDKALFATTTCQTSIYVVTFFARNTRF